MYHDLVKIPLDTLDNPKKNEDNMRIYRDKSTDQFASVIFSNKDKMYQYLDYTFHTINSYLVTKINKELLLQADKNPDVKITPLCGDEAVLFVFKGGSVMHLLYNNYLDKFKNTVPNLSSNDMIKYFIDKQNSFILNYMGVNSDAYRHNNGINKSDRSDKIKFQYDIEKSMFLENKSDSIQDFVDSILKPKFGISDIDYSIYINTATDARYLLIHGIVIKLLHVILDYITKKFDIHLKNILNGITAVEKPQQYVETNEIINVYDHPYFNISKNLKNIFCNNRLIADVKRYDGYTPIPYFNVKVQYYNKFDDLSLKDRLVYVLNLFNHNMSNNKLEISMYILYFMFDIVSYSEYLDKININFLDHKLNLENIRVYINQNIAILIESKEYDLFVIPYYDINEIDTIKKNLASKFSDLPADSPELRTKIAPGGEGTKDMTYRLINHKSITENDFEFRPKDCMDQTAKQDMPYGITTTTKMCDKIHYITYNSTIRLQRGPSITDFDLIRSKINLVMIGNHFLKNNKVVATMPLPSEFIDISVPRFDDSSKTGYLSELKHSSGLPYLLTLKTSAGKNVCLNSYGPSDMMHDLLFVLFSQQLTEPWLDTKFQKRIIRAIYFIVLNRSLKTSSTGNSKYLDNFLVFIDYCISIKNNIENSNNMDYLAILEQMVVSRNNITKENSMDVIIFYIKNLELKNREAIEMFTNGIVGSVISDDFSDVKEVVVSLLYWVNVIHKSNEDIKDYVNIGRNIYRWVPIVANNTHELNMRVTEIKNNLSKLIDTIINIGIKIYYIYNVFIDSGIMVNMKGGNENKATYEQKYLKYKNKYLAQKYKK